MTDLSERLANLSPAKRKLLEATLAQRAAAAAAATAEPLAIVGMACRFPGAPDLASYWRLIRDGIDATSDIPATRWDVDSIYDPTGELPGKISVRRAGLVDGIDQFDPQFFGISPREAARMDPQQRMLLEVAWEALEVGGLAPDALAGTPVGVFVGIGGTDYSKIPSQFADYYRHIDAHVGTGNALSIAANRVSYIFDFRGPSLAVDTACSSSTMGVHLAAQSLRNGECDVALAGGVNAILTPETTIAFSKAKMLSPVGRCRPFDAGADGYVRGEGCGFLVIKRLKDAEAHGDKIFAVLRGVATNQDGRTSGITAPNGLSQQAVIRAALAQAGLDPKQVNYIEAHGTGTKLGDPIEIEALGNVFKRATPDEAPCYVTSVKANVGHMETVSGVAGIIKVLLMMEHELIPAQLHLQGLNPRISLKGTRLAIPQAPLPWPASSRRIAGISSFGFGGANTHVVIESPVKSSASTVIAAGPHPTRRIAIVSAKSPEALKRYAERYWEHLRDHDGVSIDDFTLTANTGRAQFPNRAALVFSDRNQLLDQLHAVSTGERYAGVSVGHSPAGKRPRVAFLFTGQGSQYPGMGRGLYETQPVFRKALDKCDEILRGLLPKPLLSVLYDDGAALGEARNGDTAEPLVHQTQYTQPALFAVEYALSELWRHWGFEPQAVIGHSVGEYVAAVVAGIYSLEDGLKLIAHRARLMQALPAGGKMAALFAPPQRVREWMQGVREPVAIAAANGPENTVISGSAAGVAAVVKQCEAAGVTAQLLKVSHAFHSELMDPMLAEFKSIASQVTAKAPKIPLIANVTGEATREPLDPDYLCTQIRQTVRFADGMQALERLKLDVMLEVGPSPVLTGMGRRCLPESQVAWVSSLRQGQHDEQVLLENLGKAFLAGCRIDWKAVEGNGSGTRVSLPTFPFEKKRCWYDGSMEPRSANGPARVGRLLHPLLGRRLPVAVESDLFEQTLQASDPVYLNEHRVQGSVVFPAAGYCELASQAANQVFGSGQHAVEELLIEHALFLNEGSGRQIQVLVEPETSGERAFRILSAPQNDEGPATWTLHVLGKLRHGESIPSKRPEPVAIAEVQSRVFDTKVRSDLYHMMAMRKLDYGPAFQVLDSLSRTTGESLGRVRLDEQVVRQQEAYAVHPALGDAVFQSMAGLVPAEPDGSYSPFTYVPSSVRHIRLWEMPRGEMWTYGRRTSKTEQPHPDSVEGDVYLLDSEGRVLVEYQGVRVARMGITPVVQHQQDPAETMYELAWESRETLDEKPAVDSAGSWVVLSAGDALSDRVVETLVQAGGRVAVVRAGEAYREGSKDAKSKRWDFDVHPLDAGQYQRLWETLASVADQEPWAGVIDLWSLALDGNAEIVPDDFCRSETLSYGGGLRLIQSLARVAPRGPRSLLLVTRGAVGLSEPGKTNGPVAVLQSALWGLGRVAASEHPELRCRLIDLEPSATVDEWTVAIGRELTANDSENQIVYRQRQRHVGRFRRVGGEIVERARRQGGGQRKLPRGAFRLRFSDTGSFDSLYFERCERLPPEPGQVELRVAAAGLNFSDVLKAMGLYPGITDPVVPLGIECSGVVTAVGPGVTRFRVGDAVCGVAPFSFGSYARTAEYALVPRPDGFDDVTAASLPIAFLTAHYGLVRLAQLQPGERVLIHAGAGGVGLAAIQIAQHLGAEVFATAGSESKREFVRSLGVKHVFNSRSTDFVEQILQATKREGIDVVLNSLPGAAIPASLGLLRAYGRFLEIGKTDIYQNRMLGLAPFQDNLSYFAIDLDRMLRQRPEYIRGLFAEVMDAFRAGHYGPVALTEFSGEQIAEAFRYMAQRKNIGKVVVSFEQSADEERRAEQNDDAQSDESAAIHHGACLITGGLGAIGSAIVRWQIEQGTRHFVLLGRRAPSAEQQATLNQLPPGVQVATIQGDVADAKSLAAAMRQIPASFPEITQVYHAAGLLDDGMLLEMSLERFERPLAPKVQGTWNLHQVTRGMPVRRFVLFSSIASLMGSPGQSNYAAGNAFLDAFAAYRRQQGLPATSINWGPWGESGMAASEGRDVQLQARGLRLLDAQVSFQAMDTILRADSINLAVMDVDWQKLALAYGSSVPAAYENLVTDSPGSGGAAAGAIDQVFRSQLEATQGAERQRLLRQYFAAELARIMGWNEGQLNETQPLNELGMDSLLAMELKNNLERRLAISIPMAAFMEAPSIASLAERTAPSFDHALSAGGPTKGNANDRGYEPLIPLKPSGKRATWFCFHPLGGNLACYQDLAKHIPDDVALYGFMGRGSDGVLPPHATLDEMLAAYQEAMVRRQPEGPYHLIGWSAGGIYAYNMALRLRDAGLELGCIALIDTPLPSIYDPVDLGEDARFLFDFTNFANRFLRSNMNVTYEQLKHREGDAALEVVLEEAKRERLLAENASIDYVRRLVEVGKSHVSFIKGIQLRRLDHPVHLLHPANPEILSQLAGEELSVDMGWGQVLGDQLIMHQVPGDHFNMLLEPSVEELARQLELCRAADTRVGVS